MDALLAWNSEQQRGNREVTRKEAIHEELMHEQAWLLGQPPLDHYLEFVEEMTVSGVAIPRSTLVDEWRAANDYYGELEQTEAGIADEVEILDLDPAMRPLAKEVISDARFRRSFDTLPTRFAMVELDRLLVGHPYVSIHHTERLKARLDDSPTPDALFRFCLPLDRSEAPVQMRKTGPRSFQFWSASSDFRFQEPALLRPDQINGFDASGPVSGIVGLMVGYSPNFLTVIESDNRLLLHNGHHRAYTLRDLGFTHAPCLVQTATRWDELKLVAARTVREDPAFYFKAARPPLLKDFFDPNIRKVLRVQKITTVVEVSFDVNEYSLRDFASEN
jgi:hypothetical protein